jgi:Cu2+-containing amine oxidase
VEQVINEKNLNRNLNDLTYSEMERVLEVVGKDVDTDSFFIGNRGERVFVYSITEKKEIWSAKIVAARVHNSSKLELLEMVANDIAQKIVDLKSH